MAIEVYESEWNQLLCICNFLLFQLFRVSFAFFCLSITSIKTFFWFFALKERFLYFRLKKEFIFILHTLVVFLLGVTSKKNRVVLVQFSFEIWRHRSSAKKIVDCKHQKRKESWSFHFFTFSFYRLLLLKKN